MKPIKLTCLIDIDPDELVSQLMPALLDALASRGLKLVPAELPPPAGSKLCRDCNGMGRLGCLDGNPICPACGGTGFVLPLSPDVPPPKLHAASSPATDGNYTMLAAAEDRAAAEAPTEDGNALWNRLKGHQVELRLHQDASKALGYGWQLKGLTSGQVAKVVERRNAKMPGPGVRKAVR